MCPRINTDLRNLCFFTFRMNRYLISADIYIYISKARLQSQVFMWVVNLSAIDKSFFLLGAGGGGGGGM